MKLARLFVCRPVLSMVISIILVLAGLFSYASLKLKFYPSTFHPNITVKVFDRGSNAEIIEASLLQPLEAQLSGLRNLSKMHAVAQQGKGRISLKFKGITKEDFIAIQSEVLEKIGEVTMPPGISAPKMSLGGSDHSLLSVGVTSTRLNDREIADYVNEFLLKKIQRIPGVGEAYMVGNASVLGIHLNPTQLMNYKLNSYNIIDKINASNQKIGPGKIEIPTLSYPINVADSLSSIDHFKNLIIGVYEKNPIRLNQIADIQLGVRSKNDSFLRIDGQPGVLIDVSYAEGANPIELSHKVHSFLNHEKNNLPTDMSAKFVYDFSDQLKDTLSEVTHTIYEAIIFVVAITLLFIGRWRETLIPVITIPICIIATLFLIQLLGFSINMLTLLALILAVGLVVDDAIVVMENCSRHVQNGLTPKEAAIKGASEVGLAIIGMTLTLIAVYIPIGFVSGDAGIFFRNFSFTLAGSVLISGLVAITLSPMMCSKMLRSHKGNRFEIFILNLFFYIKDRYVVFLKKVLKFKRTVLCFFIVLVGFGSFFFSSFPVIFVPQSYAQAINFYMPLSGAFNFNYAYKKLTPLLEEMSKDSKISDLFITSFGANRFLYGQATLDVNSEEALLKKVDAYNEVAKKISAFPIYISPTDLNDFLFGGNSREGGMSVYIMSFSNYRKLSIQAQTFIKQLKKHSEITDVRSSINFNLQKYNLSIDQEKAGLLGVSIEQIKKNLSLVLSGKILNTSYQSDTDQVPIFIRFEPSLEDFSLLNQVTVESASGNFIPLSRLVHITWGTGLDKQESINQMHSAKITINAHPEVSIDKLINIVQSTAQAVLPPDTRLSFMGSAENVKNQSYNIYYLLFFSALFVFLILAVLFESFIDPFIILFTAPLCLLGGLLALTFVGGSINFYTSIGLVTLIGLVTKHGVLIVQFANQYRSSGKTVYDAIVDASAIRLRAILMTTGTMVLGAVPLALSSGLSSESRVQLGCVLIGGLILGTIFSLIIVPSIYLLINQFRERLSKNKD